MAEKKEVELEFTADTSKLKKAMREAKQFTGEMQTSSQKMNKSTLKGTKDIAKISKKTSKLKDKHGGRSAIRDEKKLQREKKQTTTEVLKQSKAYRDIQKDTGKLQNNISNITSKTRGLNRELRRTQNLFGGGGGGGRGGGGPGGGGGRRGGVAGFLGGFLKKGALGLGKMALGGLAAIPGTLLGIITSQLTGGYQERMAYGQAYGGLAGTGGKLSTLQNLRGTKSQILNQDEYSYLERLGFGPQEMAQQAAPVARATGKVGAIKTALGMQRATTMGGGEVAQFMGLLTQAGVGFGGAGGKGGKKELEKIIEAGMAGGMERARLPEFISGVSALVQRQAAATAGKVNVSGINETLAMLQASGQPGLQGARGAAVAAQVDRGIRQPGGGEAGKAFMLQAFGFGKPGGGASYYEAIQRMEQGLSNPENLRDVISEAGRQYGGSPEARALGMKKVLGIDTRIWEGLEKAVKEGDKEKIDELLQDTKTIDQQALEEMKEFGDTTKHMAGLQNRSIGIGESIETAVKRIEEVINEFVIKALPLAVKALDKIATIVEDIYIWLVGSDVEGEKAKQKYETSTKAYKKLREQRRKGEISPEKYAREIAKLKLDLKYLESDIFSTPGYPEKAAEGLQDMYIKMGRAYGLDLPGGEGKSDIEKRIIMRRKAAKLRSTMTQGSGDIMGRFSPNELEAVRRGLYKNPESTSKFKELLEREQAEAKQEDDYTLNPEFKAMLEMLTSNIINFTEEAARPKRQGNPASSPTAKPTTR